MTELRALVRDFAAAAYLAPRGRTHVAAALVFSSVVPACVARALGTPWIAVVPLVLAEMLLMAWIEVVLNGRPRIRGLAIVAPLALAAEQLVAVLALCGRTVRWGPHRFRLDARGRIVEHARR